MKKTRTWILVADGTRARIFLSEGWSKGLTPVLDEEPVGRNRAGREINSDRPGRTFESADGSRHGLAPRTDPRQHDKTMFAKEIARLVNDGAERRAYDRLVLVAPPKSLGELRTALNKPARDCLTAEIDKDLTNLKPAQLVGHLERVVPV